MPPRALTFAFAGWVAPAPAWAQLTISAADRQGAPVTATVDGNALIAKGRAGDLRVERTTFLAVEVR